MQDDRDPEWREAFDELLVFEQDFDTAMQILMFQDEKVARMSLEDAPQMTNQRVRRVKSCRSNMPTSGISCGSPSRKRRRPETSDMTRAESPSFSSSMCTQSSKQWTQSASALLDGEEAKSADMGIQKTSNNDDYIENAVGDKLSCATDTHSFVEDRAAVAKRLQRAAYDDDVHRDKERCGTMIGQLTVPSLFSTGSGKTVSVSKSRLRAYEEKLYSEEESVSGSTAVGGTTTTTVTSTDTTVPSLFSTGSGKTVSVSKSRLRAYEEKLYNVPECLTSSANEENARSNDVPNNTSSTDDGDEEGQNGQSYKAGLRTSSRSNMLSGSCDRSYIVADELACAGLDQDSAAPSDLVSRESVCHPTELHRRHDRRLPFGDKENVHPENLSATKAAASEAFEAWRSTLRSKQPSLRPGVRNHDHQYVRHQEVAKKRALKLSIDPQSKKIGKRRFCPPVPSKRLCADDLESFRDCGRSAARSSKVQRNNANEAQPFIYQEGLKISLTSLIELCDDRSLTGEDFELDRRQVLMCITAENAVNVRFARNNVLVLFSVEESYDEALFAGPRELYDQLKAGKHILETMGATFAWFLNHYRWIVWKLAAMEKSFPRLLFGKYLTKDQVLKQITHRYQRDLNQTQRSILKQILHRDASSLSCLVLCIAAVLPFPAGKNDMVDQELPAYWNVALVLTDGWYSVYAVPDAPLAAVLWKLHAKSSIVGTKLATWNASLRNAPEGIDPLECAIVRESQWKNPLLATEDQGEWPYLQLRYNSTRRVRFDTRLGVEVLRLVVPPSSRQRIRQPEATFTLLKSVPLKSLEIGGGLVRSVRVRVTRISPVLHLQAKEWTLGPRILCDDQLPLYFQLRSEYGRAAMHTRHQQDDADDSVMDDWSGNDPIDIPRPIPFVKVDVECTHPCVHGHLGMGCGILTIWRPSEELLSGGIKEGVEYFVSSLTVNWKLDGGRGHDAFLRLSSTKHSRFEEVYDAMLSTKDESKDAVYLSPSPRVCLDIQQATINYRANFEEGANGRRNERRPTIDVCVYIVLVAAREMQDEVRPRPTDMSLLDPAVKPKESRYVEHVFVTDQSCHLMSIRVSGMNVSMTKRTKDSTSKRTLGSSFIFHRGGKSVWKEGAILCLSGLEVSHYDEQLRVLDCVLVESTQLVSFPSKNSFFWTPFHHLQRKAGISTARGSSAHGASSGDGNLAKELTRLKKYVKREILQMGLSQECDEHHVEVVEHERLAQDFQAHEEGVEEVAAKKDKWEAHVVQIMPLVGPSQVMFPSDVIAFAWVIIRTHDGTCRTVYLTKEVMLTMQTVLLQQTEQWRQQAEASATTTALVQMVTDLLHKTKLRHPDVVFHLQVRQATNERLLNSWKPWERLHASYWVAEAIAASPRQT